MRDWNGASAHAVAEAQLDLRSQKSHSGLLNWEPGNLRLIYDVGAHIGEDTEFYLKKGFRVVAIEANPALADNLREKFRTHIDNGGLVVVSYAIAEAPGEVGFYLSERSEWGTVQSAFAERNASMGSPSTLIKVKAIRLQDVLAEYGTPYYLKIDVEGTDVLCLKSLLDLPDRPKYVSIESDKRSWEALLQEFELFKQLGYTKFKIVDQEQVYRQKAPRPAAEGLYIDHSFEPGSSGLFGRELPGKWLTMRQALRHYRLIYLRYYFFGDYGIIRRTILKAPGVQKAASAKRSEHSTSALRKVLNAILKIPIFETLFKSHWYDTHATM
jgi:FkbM family methyltransferase